jgi:hypothetical protein
VSSPTAGSATFTPNGNNAAKVATMTVNRAGTWVVQVTIERTADGLSTVSGPVTVTVTQTLNAIGISGAATVAIGGTAQCSAQASDQFSQPYLPPPTMTWTATGGTISASGLFSAGASEGHFQIQATASGKIGTMPVHVTTALPTTLHIDQQEKCGFGGGFGFIVIGLSLLSLQGRGRRRSKV